MNDNTKTNLNKMLSNRNIFKYCSKYFFLMVFGAIAWDTAGHLCTEKDTISNLIGATLFAGLFLSWVLILKSDVTKAVKTLGSQQNETEENK